jgi:flagella basal body P-ring formation protein FlgA
MATHSKPSSGFKLVLQISLALPLAMITFAAHAIDLSDELNTKATVVHVKPVVELEGSKGSITLADLVVATGLSRTAQETFAKVQLADAPKAGETRSFSEGGLNEIFAPELRNIQAQTGEHLVMKIPARVNVMRRRFRVDREAIEKDLQSQFKGICSDCEFEISNISVPTVGSAFGDAPEWKIRLHSEIPKGGFSLPLEINAKDGSIKTFWVSGQVAVRRKVPVVSRALQVGERIQPEDYSLISKDVTFSTESPASDAEIASSVAAHQVGAGEIIWRSQLRRELAVRSGDGLRVMAGGDEWQISIEGVAETSGYIGDSIRVKIPRTQKVVSGLLKEKGLVEVR